MEEGFWREGRRMVTWSGSIRGQTCRREVHLEDIGERGGTTSDSIGDLWRGEYVMVTEGTRNDTSEAEWSKQSESGIRTVCVVIRVSGTTLLCYSTPANEMHIYTERAKRTLYSSAEC